MGLILNIETSTKSCSVCLAEGESILSYREIAEENFSHAEKLHVFIDELMQEADKQYSDLDAIAVGKGPGSYTGLRIGVSTAKGIAYAKGIPLISVSTLRTMALRQVKNYPNIDYFSAMLDARRMEVYTAVFNRELEMIEPVKAIILDEDFRRKYWEKKNILFFGDGSDKLKPLMSHSNCLFENEKYPSSKDMISLSNKKYISKDFEDIAYFEPFYLKDFIATKPKKLI